MATKVLIAHVGGIAEMIGYLTGCYRATQSTAEQSYLRELLTKARMIQGTIEMLYIEGETKKRKK